MTTAKPVLLDPPVNIRFKLAGLWTSVMFCYVYGDYFGLYAPGKLTQMLDGRIGPLGPATQGVLVGVAALMAIPSLMVALSLLLRPGLARWLNIVLGAFYTAIMLLTMQGAWTFYVFLAVIEVALTASAVWLAWRWPRQDASI